MKLHSHYFMSIHLDWYICISIYMYPYFMYPYWAPNCRLMNYPPLPTYSNTKTATPPLIEKGSFRRKIIFI